MNEPIVVNQSLKGNILYAFGAIVLSLICLMAVFLDIRSTSGFLKVLTQNSMGYFLLKVVMAFGVLFFTYCFFYILKRVKSHKVLLRVDEIGITDNSSSIAFGFIPWKDIDDIYIDSVMGNQFIELVISNEDHYLEKLSGMKKRAVLINKRMGHQAVCITLNSTGISPEELLPKIQAMYRQSKLN